MGETLDNVKAGMKRALILFLVIDALLIAVGLAAYMVIMRPRVVAVEQARDQAVRANVAMTARVHAVEGRLALASGDTAGAQRAAGDLIVALEGLLARVPKNETRERDEVTIVKARAQLAHDELTTDPATARRDFELVDARLATLYPAVSR